MLDRRFLLKIGGHLALAGALPASAWAQPIFRADPFSLGVASGDPASDGFVLWTRLAPEPLAPSGGMGKASIEVKWEIAADEAMTKPLRKGVALAKSGLAHSVHVEIAGLESGRDYFYRFETGGVRSPIGRAKTLPAKGSLTPVRFASAGCQRYEDGLFTAWRRIAEERFDFIIHYGDYIYEYRTITNADRAAPVIREMPGKPGKCRSLEDFRNRYALYKLDADLQAAHLSAPFLMSFDDHEVENNWTNTHSAEDKITPAAFMQRRAAGFQAWYEHMPLRAPQRPKGGDIRAYRRMMVSDFLEIDVLDTRQYRSTPACGDGWKVCTEAKDAKRTMLGAAQEAWLDAGFKANKPVWTVLAQQVPIARFDRNPDPTITETHMDKWDGAEAARTRLFKAVTDAGRSNIITLAGDVHHNRACNLGLDADDPASRVIGAEFVASSISSGGDGIDQPKTAPAILSANPHLKLYNLQRGYVRHEVNRARWQADFRVLDKISQAGGVVSTRTSFTVEAGKPGLVAT